MVRRKSGQVRSLIEKEREGESTLSAVPPSSRSNEYDAVMIAELLRGVMCVKGRA
jgi:hypothetical protein